MTPPRTVLVTGASTGIGAAVAHRLDRAGYLVFAGVRKPEDGERLQVQGSDRLRWLSLDVTRADDIAAAAETIRAATGERGLGGLVNNAGIAVGGPLEFVAIPAVRLQFEVNVLGLLAVTQAMLPALRQGPGRIVNIGSIAGKSTAPMVGPYCASKHAVEALTDGLRMELHGSGIEVSVIEPGAVKTPIWDKGRAALGQIDHLLPPRGRALYGAEIEVFAQVLELNDRRGVAADLVADAVVHALEVRHPRTRYLVGNDARLRALLHWLLPDRWMDAVMRGFLRRVKRRRT